MPRRSRPVLVSLALGCVRVVARLVPRRDRAAWRQEWESEILHRHTTLDRDRRLTVGAQISLAGRAAGSLADAAWLRRQFTRDSELVHDIRHGWRVLRHRPAFTLLAASILAVGIGSTTAVFSLMDRLVMRALPYPEPGRLVSLWQRNGATGNTREEVAPGNFLDWRASATSFEGIAAAQPYSVDYISNGEPEVVGTPMVTERFFDLLRVRPLYGRLFQDGDHRAGADQVVVLSHRFWRRLGSNPNLVGQPLILDGRPHTVLGVLPKNADLNLFDSVREPDLWLPKVFVDNERRIRGEGWWAAIARLKPGVTRGQAQAEMDAISARIAKAEPRTNAQTSVGVEPLETHLMRTVRPALAVMLGAVTLVLLIACANVANLLLVRGTEREHEFALRGALGASRARLARQLLTESGILAAGATVLAVGVAWFTLRAILTLSPVRAARLSDITLDWTLLTMAIVTGAVTALLFGLAPIAQFVRRTRLEAGDGGRTASGGRRTRRLRDVLAVAEVAIAVILAAMTGLLLRSFAELVQIDPGFRPDRTAVVQVFAYDRYDSPDKLRAFFNECVLRLRALPGVIGVGSVSAMPLIEANINIDSPFAIEGRPPAARGEEPTTHLTVASPEYFSVMNIPVVAGRGLSAADHDPAEPVAVITQSLAKRHWPAGDAVGSWVTVPRFSGRPRRVKIVGIVGDVRHDALELPIRDELFVPFAQIPFGSITFVLESDSHPASLIQPARRVIWSIDPLQTIYDAATVSDLVAGSVAPRRFTLQLTAGYAAVALALAAVGIYGVMSYSTRQRTREIGVRVALGATSRDIGRLILGRGLLLGGIGVALGLSGAVAAGRLIGSQLVFVGPADPVTLVSVALVVLLVVVAACSAPVRRARRTDPVAALRDQV